jgi:hypothetical protein
MTVMELPSTSSRHALVSWLIWTAGFVSFPIAGVAAGLIAGRVDDPLAALIAGLVTGAVIGVGQWLVSRGRLRPVRWILATVVGMGLGLLLGASVVGFGTALEDNLPRQVKYPGLWRIGPTRTVGSRFERSLHPRPGIWCERAGWSSRILRPAACGA